MGGREEKYDEIEPIINSQGEVVGFWHGWVMGWVVGWFTVEIGKQSLGCFLNSQRGADPKKHYKTHDSS